MPEVRAAGGVLWRRGGGADRGLEVVVVHRPHYDDWSLPKGKVEVGETEAEAAVREVEEEAGVVGRLGPELVSTSYADRFGRAKTVRYWAMTVEEGEVGAAHEVDQAIWLPIGEARARLTYPRDAAVLDSLPAALDP